MKTINDLLKAIKNPDNTEFNWEHETRFAIMKTGTTEILAQGSIRNRKEVWKLPKDKNINGFVDIHVRAVDIQPIRIERFFINPMEPNFLTLPIIEDKNYNNKEKFSDKIVKLQVYRVGYAEPPEEVILNKTDNYRIKQRGHLNFVWSDVKTGTVLYKESKDLRDDMMQYYVKFPTKIERELPF